MESRRRSEFLGLTDEETPIVELKVGLANAVREQRTRRRLTEERLGACSVQANHG